MRLASALTVPEDTTEPATDNQDDARDLDHPAADSEYEDAKEEADEESNPAWLLDNNTNVAVGVSSPRTPQRFNGSAPSEERCDDYSSQNDTSGAYVSTDSADGGSEDDCDSTASDDGWSTSSDVETAPDYEDARCELCRGPELYTNLVDHCGCPQGRFHPACVEAATERMFRGWVPRIEAHCTHCQGLTIGKLRRASGRQAGSAHPGGELRHW